jgi:uncharacterized membrane-anchored protein
MNRSRPFVLVGLLWGAIVIGFITVKEFTLQTGEVVTLKTAPVDPRDLFRGDYVILSYDISSLDLGALPADRAAFSAGDVVYVSLETRDGYGVATQVSGRAPGEGLFLKGRVGAVQGRALRVEYGIESYFVPEGKGRPLERASGEALTVQASIDRFGNAAIKSLLLNGKPVRFR